jgi:phosphoglycolate phosphatase-like HAD superfamily hydrolase
VRDRLFLFDIDGTLVLTHGAGLRALDRAVHELCGVAGACAGIRADGKTDPAIVLEIFEKLGRAGREGEAEAILERYLAYLREEVARSRYQIMPGVNAALDLLEEHGAPVGLATGNVERGAEIKLTPGDLWRRFAFGGYGSDSHDRGELVARGIQRAEAHAGRTFDRREVWVIGDTPRDVAAAHAAGAMAIGVATGSHRPDALRASGADVVWETLEELPGWLG